MYKDYLDKILSEGSIDDLLTPMSKDDEIVPSNWSKNADGSYNVDGDVELSHRGLKELPFRFGLVTGYFSCSHNQLASLEGSPDSVGGNFYCSDNQLTNLEGAPNSVGGNFSCYDNKKKFSEEDVKKVCKVKGRIYK